MQIFSLTGALNSLRLRPTWGSMSTEEAATDATDAALMTSIAEMGRGAAAEAAIDAGVTSAAAEAAGDDAAPERVLAAPSPGDFLASEVLSCLLYDGALVKKEHVRAAKSLAATSKAWAAVDDAVRATLRKEVEAGGWGPFLVSVESTSPNARFRVSFWNAEHQDLGAFAVHDPVLMSCVLMRGVTGGRAPYDVLDAASTTFLDPKSGDSSAHTKIAKVAFGRNLAATGCPGSASGARDPLRRVTFGRPDDADERLLLRQALMDSVNEFYWTHPGLVPRAGAGPIEKCPLPPRTLGALRFFLQWFGAATSWPLERSNVLETLWSFKDAALDFGALHPIEAERWGVFLDTFPAKGHEERLGFYEGCLRALRAGEPPIACAGLGEATYEDELLCEARVRSTVPGVVPLWYGRPMLGDPEMAAQMALASEMGMGTDQCGLM